MNTSNTTYLPSHLPAHNKNQPVLDTARIQESASSTASHDMGHEIMSRLKSLLKWRIESRPSKRSSVHDLNLNPTRKQVVKAGAKLPPFPLPKRCQKNRARPRSPRKARKPRATQPKHYSYPKEHKAHSPHFHAEFIILLSVKCTLSKGDQLYEVKG